MMTLLSFQKIKTQSKNYCKDTFAFVSLTLCCLRFQFLWFNKDIKINNKPFHFQDSSKENISFVKYLCKPSGVFKSWNEIKTEYNLEGKRSISGVNSFMQIQTIGRE